MHFVHLSFFYALFSHPLICEKCIKKCDENQKVIIEEKKENINIINHKERQTRNNIRNIEILTNSNLNKIKDENKNDNIIYIQLNQQSNTKIDVISSRKEIEQNIKDKKTNDVNNNKMIIDDNKDTKICTCIGYVFFQKKIKGKNACVFYDYSSCCSWLCLTTCKLEIYLPLLIEFFLSSSLRMFIF